MSDSQRQFWATVCAAAYSRPYPFLEAIVYGSSLPVIIGYLACACASARLILLFNRMPPEQQALMWATYPTFLRFVLVGSTTGIFTWSVNIPSYLFFYTSDEISRSFASNGSCPSSSSCVAYQNAIAGYYAWQAANFVFYPLEVAVIICCKLLTVERMLLFIERPLNPDQKLRVRRAAKFVFASVVILNLGSIASSFAATVYSSRLASLATSLSAAYAAANSGLVNKLQLEGVPLLNQCNLSQTFQGVFEASALLTTISAFLICGTLCLRRIGNFMQVLKWIKSSRSRRASNAPQTNINPVDVQGLSSSGAALRWRVQFTVLVVFCTFVVRCVFVLQNAMGNASQANPDPLCGQCDTCQTWDFLMGNWCDNTPEYQLSVVLISSPLTLIVAMWGMHAQLTGIASPANPNLSATALGLM